MLKLSIASDLPSSEILGEDRLGSLGDIASKKKLKI